MRILMISTDRKAFEEKSVVRSRFVSYGELVDELSVIVFTRRRHGYIIPVSYGNVVLYPTNSLSRWFYIFDAYRIGKNRRGVDLISTQDPFETGLVGVFLAKILQTKLQVQVHTDFLSPFFTNTFLNRIRVHIAQRVIPRATCIRVVSEKIKKSLTQHFVNIAGIKVLPIFVPVKDLREGVPRVDVRKKYPQFNKIVLVASRLEKEKNIKSAINAMKSVLKEISGVGLLVVGEGSKRKNLENLTQREGLSDSVLFLGWQDDMVSYYKGADLFLVTSLYEGYGLTIVESLASGTPVLSTDVGVARESGADIFSTDEELIEKILKYSESNYISTVALKAYPYKNETEYLDALRRTWSECGKKV